MHTDTRLRVEALLAAKNIDGGVPERIWAYLITEGKVAAAPRERKIEWLVDEVLRLRALSEEDPSERLTVPTKTLIEVREGTSARLQAVSILVANEAAKDPAVRDFRAHALKGQLLPSKEAAEEWIWDPDHRSGPSTAWLTDVPVPEGYELRRDPETGHVVTEPALKVEGVAGARGLRYRALPYDFTGHEVVFTDSGGVLEKLRELSESLAVRFCWDLRAATLFVLTGQVPGVEPISVRWKISKTIPVCSRVILEIDPALTPGQVAQGYRQVRKALWAGRTRTLSEKHSRLAAFIAERSREESWRQRRAEWNRLNQSRMAWQYSKESNFRRDCVRAQRRLLTPSMWARDVDSVAEPTLDAWEKADDMPLPMVKRTSRRTRKRR